MLSLHRPDSNFPARSSLPHHAPASVRCVRAHQEVIGRPPSGGCVAIPGSYDHRCDVYSFGVLLWEVMHEAVAFPNVSSVAALLMLKENARPHCDVPHRVSQDLAALIKSCWQESPSHRPLMAEVLDALRRVQLEAGRV